MELKPGSRLKSAVCETEIVVIRSPKKPVLLACGGQALIEPNETRVEGLSISPEFAAGSLIGKRYADEETGLEVLCAKGGAGSLSADGRLMHPKEAKKLPSSD